MAVTEPGHAAMEAVDDLYRRYGGNVYRYALAVLGNHADAEDITQTTFLNAYRSLEQGVRPRKPVNWLLTIASNAIKQRFRQESARPSQVELDDSLADASHEEDGPTVGELLTALGQIPPQQRKALVLREFEGRSYREIAEILGITTAALETLLFRARRSLADELMHHLTCTDAQQAISRAADGRLGRKEKRRLREHLVECADCAHFARLQRTHRHALKGLALVPVPLSLTLFDGWQGSAAAATLPAAGVGTAAVAASGAGVGAAGGGGAAAGGLLAGGMATKAAAVVAAASVAGGVGVVGSANTEKSPAKPAKTPAAKVATNGKRLGQTAPRGVTVPGNGVARGKPSAPGQLKERGTRATGLGKGKAQAESRPNGRQRPGTKAQGPKTNEPRGQSGTHGRGQAPAGSQSKAGGQAKPAEPKPGPGARSSAPRDPRAPKTERPDKPAKNTPPQQSAEASGPGSSNGNAGGGKK